MRTEGHMSVPQWGCQENDWARHQGQHSRDLSSMSDPEELEAYQVEGQSKLVGQRINRSEDSSGREDIETYYILGATEPYMPGGKRIFLKKREAACIGTIAIVAGDWRIQGDLGRYINLCGGSGK